jgi:succinate dehydrogenase/fumarate reductase flavoprotein subunit
MGIEPHILRQTLTEYNASAAGGRDDRFGRSADTLVPLDTSRLYAISTWPGVAGTTGGPRHDERARVLRPGGEPVAGLFAAGAVSLVWGHLIDHGGGLTDAIVFGRIAGFEAAAAAGAQYCHGSRLSLGAPAPSEAPSANSSRRRGTSWSPSIRSVTTRSTSPRPTT